MGKIADKYFIVDPWSVIEDGFDPNYGLVSESVFSSANEYMGVRGYFEEGYSGEGHVGSYFNGFFEETPIFHPARYKGFVDVSRDMVNSVDWLYTRIEIDGEQLDLAKCQFEEFKRTLNFKSGIMNRSYIWTTQSGKKLKIKFERILSMEINHVGCQRIEFEPLNFSGEISVISGLDFTPRGQCWDEVTSENNGQLYSIMAQTKVSKLRAYSSFRIDCPYKYNEEVIRKDRFIGVKFFIKLEEGIKASYDKIAVNYAAKKKEASKGMMKINRVSDFAYSSCIRPIVVRTPH
ncbi:MAG: glycoside hydrolase [Firmicutes bacterium]|nr:glycoside hydrolase [Bacillota bacterium]